MKVLVGISLGFVLSCCSKHSAPEHLSAKRILQIELGMTQNEVIEILNEPISIKGTTFQFTEKHGYNYPMLWVDFDSSGVSEVYAKYYYWIDDKGIYGLSKDRKTGEEYRWGEDALMAYFN